MYFCETGDRIALAACELVRAGGPGYATMRRIAAIVGIAPSAIYRHYDSKEHLLETVAQRESVRLSSAINGGPRGGPERKFVRAVRLCVKLAHEHPHSFALLRDRAKGPRPASHVFAGPLWAICSQRGRAFAPSHIADRAKMIWAAIAGGAALFHSGELADTRALATFTKNAVNNANRGDPWIELRGPGYRSL